MSACPRVRCPVCKQSGDWFAGKYGPFCSRRCKLIDLGRWFGEEHIMSEPLRPEQWERPSDARAGDRPDKRPSN
jgi:endogenous inhibitor of DNA gyrase (YacG/DUF329 family)